MEATKRQLKHMEEVQEEVRDNQRLQFKENDTRKAKICERYIRGICNRSGLTGDECTFSHAEDPRNMNSPNRKWREMGARNAEPKAYFNPGEATGSNQYAHRWGKFFLWPDDRVCESTRDVIENEFHPTWREFSRIAVRRCRFKEWTGKWYVGNEVTQMTSDQSGSYSIMDFRVFPDQNGREYNRQAIMLGIKAAPPRTQRVKVGNEYV